MILARIERWKNFSKVSRRLSNNMLRHMRERDILCLYRQKHKPVELRENNIDLLEEKDKSNMNVFERLGVETLFLAPLHKRSHRPTTS